MFSFSFGDDLKNCSIAFTLSYFVYMLFVCVCMTMERKSKKRKGIKIKFDAYMLFHA